MDLGSPGSLEVKDIKRYLKEFSMDERVVGYPYWLHYLIVRGITLNVHPSKTSEAYKKIWWEKGPPLIIVSKRLTAKVQA